MLIKESSIPDWLKRDLDEDCPYCGSKYHLGYSPDGLRVTKHYCPNPYCSETITKKMVFMWGVLGVSGIKEGNSRTLVKNRNLKHHLQAIPIHLSDKPVVTLAMFMRMCCIEGLDSKWNEICDDIETLDDVLKNTDASNKISTEEIQYIREALDYVTIKPKKAFDYECVKKYNIMMTGSNIMDLSNRDLFPAFIEHFFKGLVRVTQCGKRQNNVSALIMEEGTASSGKSKLANDSGIPIYTSTEFIVRVYKDLLEAGVDQDELKRIYSQ